MPNAIKKSTISNIKDIYALLGVSWQTVYKWRENPTMTQTRSNAKYDFIKRAGALFSLGLDEMESLANKAGLSLCGLKFNDAELNSKFMPTSENINNANKSESFFALFSAEPTKLSTNIKVDSSRLGSQILSPNLSFSAHLNALLATYQGKKK